MIPTVSMDPAQLDQHRPALWGLAYRITGSAADADDIAQEALARALVSQPVEPRPWMYKVACNLAKDQLRRRKRAAYRGPWLPTPVAEPLRPDQRLSLREDASMAMLLALERLSAAQRVVLVLRDAMGLSVAETAAVLGVDPVNVRVTHLRARRRLGEVPAPEPEEHAQALSALLAAIAAHDLDAVMQLLADDAVSLADSDGLVQAQGVPVTGTLRIARFLLSLSTPAPGDRFGMLTLNGLPALYAERPGLTGRAPRRWAFQVLLGPDGKILHLLSFVHPHKLRHLGEPGTESVPASADPASADPGI